MPIVERDGITVYSNESCVQCTATYRSLDNLGVEYEVIKLSTLPQEEIEAFKEAGLMQAPIVQANGERWSGFNPDKIKLAAFALRAAQQG